MSLQDPQLPIPLPPGDAAGALHPTDGRSPGTAVAIFASREDLGTLQATLDHLRQALTTDARVDLVVNGHAELAAAARSLTMRARQGRPVSLQVWHIPLACKANAWNQYIHRLWAGGQTTCFLDGYVRLHPLALARMVRAMRDLDTSLGGSGAPASGRSAGQVRETLQRDGGLHGNCFALHGRTVQALRQADFHLPVGLYGFDTVLGAALSFGLDPRSNGWAPKRFIANDPGVSWQVPTKHWWHPQDLRTHWARLRKNGLRQLVRRATQYHFEHEQTALSQLPRTVEDYVLQWADACPQEAAALLQSSLFARLAMQRLQGRARRPDADRLHALQAG